MVCMWTQRTISGFAGHYCICQPTSFQRFFCLTSPEEHDLVGFYMVSGDLNSSLHACKAIDLPTDVSLSLCLLVFFFFFSFKR